MTSHNTKQRITSISCFTSKATTNHHPSNNLVVDKKTQKPIVFFSTNQKLIIITEIQPLSCQGVTKGLGCGDK